jgi:hypothetical protein
MWGVPVLGADETRLKKSRVGKWYLEASRLTGLNTLELPGYIAVWGQHYARGKNTHRGMENLPERGPRPRPGRNSLEVFNLKAVCLAERIQAHAYAVQP